MSTTQWRIEKKMKRVLGSLGYNLTGASTSGLKHADTEKKL